MLSSKNECWICQRYHYTIVFYDRSCSKNNKGLTEIHDEEFLEKLRGEYNENIEKYKTDQPIICGTLVNKAYNQK
jgi:hypothetical protein